MKGAVDSVVCCEVVIMEDLGCSSHVLILPSRGLGGLSFAAGSASIVI